TDRVGDIHEHDGHGAGRLQQWPDGCAATSHDNVWQERDKFRYIFANAVDITCRPPSVDPHIATVGPSKLVQLLQERRVAGLTVGVIDGRGMEHADAPHRLVLLRECRKRPSCSRAAKEDDEFPSLQSVELHSVPRQPGPDCRISNWRGTV